MQCMLRQPANKGIIKQSIHLQKIFFHGEHIKEENKADFISKADFIVNQGLK